MAATRTPEELRAAVESMFRIRAVESPPDPGTGLRKVWHRGALHAELVSEIDGEGRAVRHELTLFDDVLVWERGRGLVTGSAKVEGSARGAAGVAFDLTADPDRVSRARGALERYEGIDRILLHLRSLLLAGERGATPLEDLGAVTDSRLTPVGPPPAEPSPAPAPTRRSALPLALLGLGLIALALALLLSK
jgi:hypothetical protein